MSVKVTTQLQSLASTAARSIKNRKLFADEETKEKRRKHCFSCPELDEKARCKKCGCKIINKTAAAGATCPLGKW